jgi:putative RNA 2'-phosphotransferase
MFNRHEEDTKVMDPKRRVRSSKFLSLVLRHEPEKIGLTLQPGGWVEVQELLDGCARSGHPLTVSELRELVETSDKQRFALDDSGVRIRANQGHSADVDLQLTPAVPPGVLYHGSAAHLLPVLLAEGLRKMARHHVHLSVSVAPALKVGQRHGKPVVLTVDAGRLHADGGVFFCSANGVWLIDAVPPAYLQVHQ